MMAMIIVMLMMMMSDYNNDEDDARGKHYVRYMNDHLYIVNIK